jgi:TonB family protein
MAAQLRDQYDQKIRELQGQLTQAQKDAAERETLMREQQRLEAERKVREAEEAAAAAKKPPAPATETAAAKPAGDAPAGGAPAAGGAAGAAGSPAERVAEAAAPAQTRPSPPPPAVKKEPEAPAIKVGDLIAIGDAGAKPPELTRQPVARYPPMAQKLNKTANVDVRVLVDENGNVRTADLLGKKVGFGFDEAALEAARAAKYRPATKHGVRVKMYVNLRIRFDL